MGGKFCQKYSWHKGAPAAFCHLLDLKNAKTSDWGSSSFPSKSLFVSQKRKKKKFKTTSVFCNSCTAWKSKAALFLQFYFFFPFRENNHLEASLHSAPKETIFKKNEADAPCCFSWLKGHLWNKRWELQDRYWTFCHLCPSPLVPAQIQHMVKYPSAFWIYGEARE